MNKNYIILLVVGLVLLAGAGFAFWSVSQSPSANQTPTDNTSSTSNNTNTNVQAGAPMVETNSSTTPSISAVIVKGTVNPNGALTTYWYEYGQTSALGAKTGVYLLGSGYTTSSAPGYITGLSSNTNYYFRLTAKNSLGTVNGQTYTFKTNTAPVPVGNSPTISTTSATNVARTTASLTGRINPNGAQTTFWFEYGTNSDLGFVTAFQSAGTDSVAQSVLVSLSNLQPLTKYYFRLNAQNQFGTVNGQILNFTTQGPTAAPTVITTSASSINDSSAKLGGSVNPSGVATTYWFEYSDNALLSNVIVSTTPQQSLNSGTSAVNVSTNLSNLNNNTKYYFRLVAKNQYGTVSGDIKSFTTKN